MLIDDRINEARLSLELQYVLRRFDQNERPGFPVRKCVATNDELDEIFKVKSGILITVAHENT